MKQLIKQRLIPYSLLKKIDRIDVDTAKYLIKFCEYLPCELLPYLHGEELSYWIESNKLLLKERHNKDFKKVEIRTIGSSVLYKTDKITVVIDPSEAFANSFNEKVDCILISHSHKDHIDGLELLVNKNPSSVIFMTPMTEKLLSMFQGLYGGDFNYYFSRQGKLIEPFNNFVMGDIKIEAFYAGHSPGAVMYLLSYEDISTLITGDFAFRTIGGLSGASILNIPVDILVCECTHLNDTLPTGFSSSWHRELKFDLNKKEMINLFLDNIHSSASRWLVLSGALSEAQEIYSLIALMQQSSEYGEKLSNMDIYWTGLPYRVAEIYHNLEKANSIWQIEPVENEHGVLKKNSITFCAGDDHFIEVGKNHIINIAEELEDTLIFISDRRNIKLKKDYLKIHAYTHAGIGEILYLISMIHPSLIYFYHGAELADNTRKLLSKINCNIM